MVNVRDKMIVPDGVNATDIPIGATVNWTSGVDQGSATMVVRMRKGKKVLAHPGSVFGRRGYPDLFSHGQGGSYDGGISVGWGGRMTVLSLPKGNGN